MYDFLIAFDELMTLYNKQQSHPDLHINWHQRRTYLQNAISPVKSLRDVADRETDRLVMGGTPFTYEQYMEALKSAATRIDEGRVGRSKREINMTHQEHEPVKEEECEPDIEYLINELKRGGFKGKRTLKMNAETWKSLSPEAQEIWDKLEQDMKSKILGSRVTKVNKTLTTPSRKVNIVETVDDDEESQDESEEKPSIQVNNVLARARSEAHPGDPRRMMGSTKPSKKEAEKETDGGTKSRLHAMVHRFATYESDSDSDEGEDFEDYWKSRDFR
jgi:hypothetical protein